MSNEERFVCEQIEILLSYYIHGDINDRIRYFIETHLQKCSTCRIRYEFLKNKIKDMHLAKAKIDTLKSKKIIPISLYNDNFKEKMSAYIDNELSNEESLKFKKYAIANPPVKTELENMYKIKNVLNLSYEKTKNNFKEDFSREIMRKSGYKTDLSALFFKIASIFIFISVFLSISFIVLN